MAFFRFYFDAEDERGRIRGRSHLLLVHDGDGDARARRSARCSRRRSRDWLFSTPSQANLVRAAFVLVWAQMNYEQLTSLFRVEERSVAYVAATLVNVVVTVGATIELVAVLHKGAIGVIVGNFTGTLGVYFALLAYRRFQLGLEFDRPLFRQMQRFGLPLVPSGLALWAIDFADRFLLLRIKDAAEVGLYSVGVRVSSALLLLLIALRTAWPAFAYSIEDDTEAKRTYAFVLTYVLYICCWASLALSLLAPWIVRAADGTALLQGLRGRAAARLRRDGLHRVQRHVDRDRPREADAVQLGRDRNRRGASTSGSAWC